MSTSLLEFEKALASLSLALAEDKSDIVRDATSQRFEFCVELSWKSSKKAMGTSAAAPKVIIREMAAQGLIFDVPLWLDFIEGRNLSSHSYHEEVAEKVYALAQRFLPEGLALLTRLRQL